MDVGLFLAVGGSQRPRMAFIVRTLILHVTPVNPYAIPVKLSLFLHMIPAELEALAKAWLP